MIFENIYGICILALYTFGLSLLENSLFPFVIVGQILDLKNELHKGN